MPDDQRQKQWLYTVFDLGKFKLKPFTVNSLATLTGESRDESIMLLPEHLLALSSAEAITHKYLEQVVFYIYFRNKGG